MAKFYCQREIEMNPICKTQCEHCKEYYKPLEKEKIDYHLKTFCLDFREVSIRKLSHKIEVDYGTLRNWWVGKKIGSKSIPTLPIGTYLRLLEWAKFRGYDENRQYDNFL